MSVTENQDVAPKYRTITLSDHAPVRILDSAWPTIASARWWEGEHEFQANRKSWLRVRQHADGRTIVYAGSSSAFPGEGQRAGGELLPKGTTSKQIVAAIRRVGADVAAARCVDEAIADLPAEELA